MSMRPRVFSLTYSTRVGFLCLIEKGVSQQALDEIQLQKIFIHRLCMDALTDLSSLPVPKMYLCKGFYTDFIWAENGMLMLNQRVVDAFDGELEVYGELHPVECEKGPYYFYRVTNIIEAMDLEAISQFDTRYQSEQEYNSISQAKYEFVENNIAEALIFKDINGRPPRRTFLGERFIDVLKKYRFSGVATETFKPIWPRA